MRRGDAVIGRPPRPRTVAATRLEIVELRARLELEEEQRWKRAAFKDKIRRARARLARGA